jgi:hypothetical protein
MFERFTDRARRVLVLAEEEARLYSVGYIGTEHILVGLVHEGEGIAATALPSGVSLEAAREKVRTLGLAGSSSTDSHPYSPRAKKALEYSLRESLRLGHGHISTGHILLGLFRQGDGAGVQVLVGLGVDLVGVRQRVILLLAKIQDGQAEPAVGNDGVVGSATPEPYYESRAFVRTRRSPFVPGTWVNWNHKLGGGPTVRVEQNKLHVFAPKGMLLESRDLQILASKASIRRQVLGWAGTPIGRRNSVVVSARQGRRRVEVAFSAPAEIEDLWCALVTEGFRPGESGSE